MTSAADEVLVAEGLGKRYRRGRLRTSVRMAVPGRRTEGRGDWFDALHDVDLTIGKGESVGLVGPNGAGKSTFLKLVAETIQPSAGKLCRRGRIGPMIELGLGFHPDLTGRENIRLTGTLLGLDRAQLAHRLDAIVEFADIGDALDTPVKRYSSGMLARLGFGVAAQSDADILLVDEVLSVGDAEFRRRCYEYMQELVRERGTTLVFVSHNVWLVEQLCERVVWIEKGEVVEDGPTSSVLAAYVDAHRLTAPGLAGRDPDRIRVRTMAVEPAVTSPSDPIEVTAEIEAARPSPRARALLELRNPTPDDPDPDLLEVLSGPERVWLAVTRTELAPTGTFAEPGRYRLTARLRDVPLPAMDLEIAVVIADSADHVIDWAHRDIELVDDQVTTSYGAEVRWMVEPVSEPAATVGATTQGGKERKHDGG